MIRGLRLAGLAMLTVIFTAACDDPPTGPADFELESASASAPGSEKSRGATFAENTATGFNLGTVDGRCSGTYANYRKQDDFRRTNPDGTIFQRKQYDADPLVIVLNSGDVYRGSGIVRFSRTFESGVGFTRQTWTINGRVEDAAGVEHTVVCIWRDNGVRRETRISILGGRDGNNPYVKLAAELISPTLDRPIRQNDPTIGCPFDASRGYGSQIVFDWSDVRHRTGVSYELRARRQGSTLPLVNIETSESTYTHRSCGGYVIDQNLDDWGWEVRAITGDGLIGPWVSGEFRFEPCRLADGRPCGT